MYSSQVHKLALKSRSIFPKFTEQSTTEQKSKRDSQG